MLFHKAAEVVTVGNTYRFGGLTDGEVRFTYKVTGYGDLHFVYIAFRRDSHLIFKDVLKAAQT